MRLPRPPLPLTSITTLLLLLVPALLLLRMPRPTADGLERLMAAASLIQSFPATPENPLPELWKQRLGTENAERLWRSQRRLWWQFWGPHAEAAASMALPASSFGSSGTAVRLPPHSLRVGDLVVIAPDALARQLMEERLRPVQRPGRGLERRCLDRLEQQQAVYWNPTAVAEILGPLAPLLQRFQEGCLTLELEPGAVSWAGEAASVEGLGEVAGALGKAAPPPAQLPPLPAELLLELEGRSLDQLLEGLLSRDMIRQPLAARYGIDTGRLEQLRRTPFRLRLLPQEQGPFRASLELQLPVGDQASAWQTMFTSVAEALRQEGFTTQEQPVQHRPSADPPTESQGAEKGATANAPMTWRRPDGAVVGGWRWIGAGGPSAELLLFLGPAPVAPLPLGWDRRAPEPGLRLRVRSDALERLGLLPEGIPPLVRRSSQLWLETEPAGSSPDAGISRLRGRLRLER